MEEPKIEPRRRVQWLYKTSPRSPARPAGPDRQERDTAVIVRSTRLQDGRAPVRGGLAERESRTRRQPGFPAGSAPEPVCPDAVHRRDAKAAPDPETAPYRAEPSGLFGVGPSDGVQIDWP